MNRFKFRIWDKKYNDWLNPNCAAVSINGEVLSYRRGGILSGGSQEHVQSNYIIQQFTGLKDKNNKEIFEGDVMTWNRPPHLVGEQEFNEWDKLGRPLNQHTFEVHYKYGQFHPFNGWGEYHAGQGEVIGNVLENNELLK